MLWNDLEKNNSLDYNEKYNYMKSSLSEADRHDASDKNWDHYPPCEILPNQVRDKLSRFSGQVVTFEKSIINT